MKLNPYTFLYCSFYKFLEKKTNAKDRISFAVQSFSVIGFMIYFMIVAIIIKTNYNIPISLKMNKYIFGLAVTIGYYSLNYFLFDKNDRYINLLEKYNNLLPREKLFHLVFWMIVLIIPVGLKIL
jgi:hypothetical protein